jgi:L-lactate utilization protein LutB
MTDNIRAIRNKLAGEKVCETFKSRGFDAYYCETSPEALEKALSLIPEQSLVSWGGCKSCEQIGLLDAVKAGNYKVLDRDSAKTPEERVAIMKQALGCDVFLTGTNALTETGELVNIDGNGNRVAAMIYGPDSVIVIAGMNKLVPDIEAAYKRARTEAAPVNIQRFDLKTPCKADGLCHDCNSPDCVCNYIVRTRRCKPAGKIKLILVGEVLGY